jgi:phosphoglycolate phosphatase-like HAD superfamily hydrolase
MDINKSLLALILLCCITTSSLQSHNIIFALDELLFTLDAKPTTNLLNIGWKTWIWIWWQGGKPVLTKKIMETLDQIPPKTQLTMEQSTSYVGQKVSPIICEWLLGRRKAQDVGTDIIAHLRSVELKDWNWIKAPLLKICEIAFFDVPKLMHIIKPAPQGVDLLQQCYRTHRHNLYIVSNSPQEIFRALKERHPEIFNLFNGIVISSNIGLLKPNAQIYMHLMQEYNLNPQDCLFIGTAKDSIKIAQNFGMKTIHWDPYNYASGMAKLEEMGIL